MNYLLPILVFLVLFAAMRWLLSSDVDRAAGVDLRRAGDLQSPPEVPTPDLLACQCAQCRCIRCADTRWRPEGMVPLPAGCRVSHGLCPVCERAAHAEINRIVISEIRTPSLATA